RAGRGCDSRWALTWRTSRVSSRRWGGERVFALPASVRVVLAVEPVDMRKSIDGLMALVRGAWGEDVYSGHLFAFVSRRGDRIKVLTWSRGGFVLLYVVARRNRSSGVRRTRSG
ncbi:MULTISPECIES: IS66 family insertion sequence element accessory protein TnpB, partial [Corallococcus]|uniref:IS66 family insertion sequence element accessory protein TnpB n=1 Tax=Corallococcus TaxID=83461 RepID=UPI0011C4AAC2